MKYPPNNIRPNRNGTRMIASDRDFDSPLQSGVAQTSYGTGSAGSGLLKLAHYRVGLQISLYQCSLLNFCSDRLEFLRRHSDFFSLPPLPDGQRYHPRGGWN